MNGPMASRRKDELNSEHASYSGSMAHIGTADDFNSGAIPSMQSPISYGVNVVDDIMPCNSASAQGCDLNAPAMTFFNTTPTHTGSNGFLKNSRNEINS